MALLHLQWKYQALSAREPHVRGEVVRRGETLARIWEEKEGKGIAGRNSECHNLSEPQSPKVPYFQE